MKNRIIKLLLLNLGIALVNVVAFSKGLLGLGFTGGALTTAISATIITMSVLAFGYGNYTLLFSEPKAQPIKLLKNSELNTAGDYITALQGIKGKPVFDEVIQTSIEQLYRMEDKDKALDIILEQYFTVQEITYTRFQNAIDSVRVIFFNNVKKMINRIIIFDYKDYKKVLAKIQSARPVYGRNNSSSSSSYERRGYNNGTAAQDGSEPSVGVAPQAASEQYRIYREHITYVNSLVDMNENILTKLDGLLLEISKLDDINEQDLENMAAIQEINSLIAQTKYYKA